jgi:type II secretory pathway pseudopilin PulG
MRGQYVSERNRGFTLIEALIAMVIVFVTVSSLLLVVPFAFNNTQMNAVEVQAVAVGQRFLDDERNAKLQSSVMPTSTSLPIDPGQGFMGGSAGNFGNFDVTPDGCATVQTAGINTNVYSCSVNVTWTENSATRSVTVQSYVTK